MSGHFIEFEQVKKEYRSGEVPVVALQDATFFIERGEICVIVGVKPLCSIFWAVWTA